MIAAALSPAQPKEAVAYLRRAYEALEAPAGKQPDTAVSNITPTIIAALLVPIAEQIDPTLTSECLWRAVALHRPPAKEADYFVMSSNAALSASVALYDVPLARLLLPEAAEPWAHSREMAVARCLTDPHRAVELAEKAGQDPQQEALRQAELAGLLTTDPARVRRHLHRALGVWPIDAEDHDW